MKQFLKKYFIAPLKPQLLAVIEFVCGVTVKLAAFSHKTLMRVQWNTGENPEFFDQTIGQYYLWNLDPTPLWAERGVFGSLALKKDGRLLEIACGDGFYTRRFYSATSKSIVACDFDTAAIRTAIRKNSAANISYVLADIRTHMPGGGGEIR